MGDGAADGTSKSEAGIEVGSAHGGSSSGLSLLDDGVDLGGRAGHFGYLGFGRQTKTEWRWVDGEEKRAKRADRAGKSFATEVLAIEPFWRVEMDTEAREGGKAGAAEKQSQTGDASRKKLVR